LARFTKYGHIIKSADKVILVFLDRASSYHYEKDLLAVGACIQNMLLAAFSLGIGSCWLGEILKPASSGQRFSKNSPAYSTGSRHRLGLSGGKIPEGHA